MANEEDKKIRIINKRNRAVFAVPLKDARELLDNYGDLVETKDEMPEDPKPGTPVNPDELKILGENDTVETAGKETGSADAEIITQTKDEMPEDPKPVVSAASAKPAKSVETEAK